MWGETQYVSSANTCIINIVVYYVLFFCVLDFVMYLIITLLKSIGIKCSFLKNNICILWIGKEVVP